MSARPRQTVHRALRISVDSETEFLILDERVAQALTQEELFPDFCGGVCNALEAAYLERQKGKVDGDGDVILDLTFDWEAPPEIPVQYLLVLRADNQCVVSPLPTIEGHLSMPLR